MFLPFTDRANSQKKEREEIAKQKEENQSCDVVRLYESVDGSSGVVMLVLGASL